MTTLFISYSHKDSEFAHNLAADLKTVGYIVWIDASGLIGGEQWAREIETSVRGCDTFILIISPDSVASEWSNKETLLALELHKRIVPVLVRETVLPVSLVDIQYVDFRGGRAAAFQELLQALPTPATPQPQVPPTGPRVMPTRATSLRRKLKMWPLVSLVFVCLLLGGLGFVEFAPTLNPSATATPPPFYTSGLITYFSQERGVKRLYVIANNGVRIKLAESVGDLIVLGVSPDRHYIAIAESQNGSIAHPPTFPRFLTAGTSSLINLVVVSNDGLERNIVVRDAPYLDAAFTPDGQLLTAVLKESVITYSIARPNGSSLRLLYVSKNLIGAPTPESTRTETK